MPRLRTTLHDPADVGAAAGAGAQGVGLVGLETVVLAGGVHPRAHLTDGDLETYALALAEALLPVCEAFPGWPVWVRTLDFADADLATLRGAPDLPADAHFFTRQGIRRDIAWPEHHAAQWLAFQKVHAAGGENLGVVLSAAYDAEQLRAAQWMRDSAGLGDVCGLGILAQTPAVALRMESFIDAGVDAVVFDTDRLAELTLGLAPAEAREHGAHPAVMRLVGGASAVCAHAGIEVTVCGSGVHTGDSAAAYLALGVDAISCEPAALAAVRGVVEAAPEFSHFRGWKSVSDDAS